MLRTYPEDTAQIAIVFEISVAVLTVVSQHSGSDNASLKRGVSVSNIFTKTLGSQHLRLTKAETSEKRECSLNSTGPESRTPARLDQ